MKIKPEKQAEYDVGWNNNEDPYGRRCFTFAQGWADKMEERMAAGAKLEDVAEECSREEDTDGITGFMYSMAVSILAQCWEHGEELRRWHNIKTQLRDEGERANETGGVLNPALLNIGP